MRGDTIVYGTCVSVGGDRPRAVLRIDGQKRLVRVVLTSKEQAKTLAGSLYAPVGIEGQARWDVATGDVVSIRAEHVFALAEDTPDQVMGWFKRVVGPGWNAVNDPSEVLRELGRGVNPKNDAAPRM